MTRPAVLVTGAAGYVGALLVNALATRRADLSALVALDWSGPGRFQTPTGVTNVQQDI